MKQDTPSVALVVLDTMRKDYFDRHFDWLPGTRYENAWSTSHWTVPAHTSLFTGKYASEVGVHAGNKDFSEADDVLPEILSNNGYTTKAYSCNVNISKNWNFDRGFDFFTGNWRVRSVDGNIFNWGRFIEETRDKGPERFVEAVKKCVFNDVHTTKSLKRGALLKMRDLGIGKQTVDDGSTEFLENISSYIDADFLFVNLMEAHRPYNPPEEYREADDPEIASIEATLNQREESVAQLRRAYNGAVRYQSAIYRDIFDRLYNEFDYIVTVGDHGEMLGEDNVYEHMYGIYKPLTHVPLVVSGESGGKVREVASIIDIYQTILNIFNVEKSSRGEDLRSLPGQRQVMTEYHTMHHVNFQSTLNHGFTRDKVSFLLEPLDGVAGESWYIHETFKQGLQKHGHPPAGVISQNRAKIPRKEINTTHEDIDESTKSHLEDLGYG